jgi:hypothetical protein
MNLRSWIKSWCAFKPAAPSFFRRRQARFNETIFGQNIIPWLQSEEPYMLLVSLSLSVRRAVVCLCWGLSLALPAAVPAQTNYYAANGMEYAVAGSWPGEQIWPDAAVTTSGGYVVWQDNITDGSGWGLSAQRLDSTLSATLSTFRVNAQGTNDQEKPRVALLKNGGAAFVWQGGKPGFQQIYARLLSPTNTWLTTNDVLLSLSGTNAKTYTTNLTVTIVTNRAHGIYSYKTNTAATIITNAGGASGSCQITPAVATLNNGNLIVVYASFNQAGSNSLQDVYGQLLSPAGQKIGANFLVNQFITYNQRTPAVTALPNGGFAVAWVSEQQRSTAPDWGTNSTYYGSSAVPLPSVDINARLYNSNGVAQGSELLVNADVNPCANPAVAAAADGGFMVAWSAFNLSNPTNSWDLYARPFSAAGAGGTVLRVNTRVYGDEFAPHISAIGQAYMIVWTSLGQDGDREGVYGQFVHGNGSLIGREFLVNTTTRGQQIQPAIASDGVAQFLVMWSSSTFTPASMDLFAQRYIDVSAILQPIASVYVHAPFTLSNGVYQPQLQVSWPALLGISVSNYEVYVDGAAAPTALTASNTWTMTAAEGLTRSSTHSFEVDYVTTDGRRSPISPSASGTTWSGGNWYGIPSEWMEEYYGASIADWPSVNAKLAAGGPTLMQVFLSGGNPLDSGTWLVTALAKTEQGMFLSWNTRPGFTYQVQVSTNFSAWSNTGSPRFAAGATDSIYVGGGSVGYFRIVLVR